MKNQHPAPFPVALIERIISSTNAKVVLDPFIGSGTTAIASKKLGRNFVGIDISPEYVKMAKNRLKHFAENKIENKLLMLNKENISQMDIFDIETVQEA